MELKFEARSQYGRVRYFALNSLSECLLKLAGRRCFEGPELELLRAAGFAVLISNQS